MFEALKEIVTIYANYTTMGNLTIATGRGDGIRDSLVIRSGREDSNPVISGSSLKGMIRSTLEAIFTEAYKRSRDNKFKVCVPSTCYRKKLVEGEDGRRYLQNIPVSDRLEESCDVNNLCPACRMFGMTQQAGRVIFHDARAKEEYIQTIDRTHVAIARDTKTAAGGALVTTETVPADVTFYGRIDLINPEPWMMGAVISTLELLPFLGVGAKKTSGYGDLKVKIGDEDIKRVITWRSDSPEAEPRTKQDYITAWEQFIGADFATLEELFKTEMTSSEEESKDNEGE